MIIIGITGTLGAGKGTIVDYLVKNKNFKHFSVRAFLSEEIKRRNLPVDRDSLVHTANDLRAKHGPSYIAEQLLEEAKKSGQNCVIESIRTEGEVEAIRKKGNCSLFAIDADPKIRYERAFKRGSETDNKTFEQFIADEKREMTSTDSNKQNLSKCISMANFIFQNNGTLEELHKKVDEVLLKMETTKTENKIEKYLRPTWDEYFMEIVNAVSRRGTCDRGRTGVVFARDKQVLVTGYVGAPIGLPHCDDIGHQLKKTIHEDGTITQHCVRTIHGEQNAICQAAKRGVSLEGATLYCKLAPCRTCAMLLINCGIKRVVCQKKYHAGTKASSETEDMFKIAGIKLEYITQEGETYDKM